MIELKNSHFKVSMQYGGFDLPVSPYFSMAGRDIRNPSQYMAKKALVDIYQVDFINASTSANVTFFEDSTGVCDALFSAGTPYTSNSSSKALADDYTSQILAEAVSRSYSGFTTADITFIRGNIGPYANVYSNPSRTLNSAFQVSTIRAAQVSYSVDIATSVSLSGGAVGTVFLEYADDSVFTTNVKEIGRMVNGNTGTLVVGLTLNQTATATVTGIVPAGKYVRIRTANTTGTPTFTFRSAQEVLL